MVGDSKVGVEHLNSTINQTTLVQQTTWQDMTPWGNMTRVVQSFTPSHREIQRMHLQVQNFQRELHDKDQMIETLAQLVMQRQQPAGDHNGYYYGNNNSNNNSNNNNYYNNNVTMTNTFHAGPQEMLRNFALLQHMFAPVVSGVNSGEGSGVGQGSAKSSSFGSCAVWVYHCLFVFLVVWVKNVCVTFFFVRWFLIIAFIEKWKK